MQLSDVDLLDLDRVQRGEHHEMLEAIRREDPLYWHDEPGGSGFWCITKHADLVEVNREPNIFSSEVGGINIPDHGDPSGEGMDPRGLMMLYTDPPKHTRYRLLVNKGFTPRMIGLLEMYLRHRSILIVDNIIERSECDFVVDLASELPLQAIAEIMGVPQDDRMMLFKWSNAMIGMDDPEYNAEDDGMTASAELYAYVNQLAKDRANDPRDDVVTRLINAEVEGEKLSELEFDMFMLLLTVAGNETTRNTTTHGMHALLTNPEQWEALKADPDNMLDPAIEEILRWATPVLHFRRTATEDYELRGKQIKAGEKVVMWHISANRDEEVFDDPFRFDISRDPNPHVAFGGGGAHYCLGANLAQMELRLIFDEILRRIPDMTLAGEPQYLRSNFVRGIKRMPVAFRPGDKVNPGPVPTAV